MLQNLEYCQFESASVSSKLREKVKTPLVQLIINKNCFLNLLTHFNFSVLEHSLLNIAVAKSNKIY